MNLKIKHYTTFLLLLLSSFSLCAGFSQTDNFTQVDGLPCNCVNHIFEDSRGLIWLATDAGLCEFNGYEVSFREELNRLQGEKVTGLAEDENGNLIITASGVGVCEFDGEKLEILKSPKENAPIEIRSVSNFNKSVIIGTSNGLFVAESNNDSEDYSLVGGSENINVSAIIRQNEKLIVFPKFELGSSVYHSKRITSSVPKSQKVLEVNAKAIELEVGEQIILKTDEQNITCDVINTLSNKNELFVLLRYFKNGMEHRKLISIKEGFCIDYLERNNLQDVFVQSLFKHKLTNDVWLGTKNHGLIRLKQSIFSLFNLDDFMPAIGNVVDFVSLLDGSIFLAGNGIGKFADEKVQEVLPVQEFQKLLPSNHKESDIILHDIEKDGDVIWIATNHGFFTLNANTFRLEYQGISKALKFIVLSNNSLFYFDGKRFVSTKMNSRSSKKVHMELSDRDEMEITKMIEFDSNVWVSTENQGIYRFGKDKVLKYGRNNCGIHNVVNDMLILPDSSIIAGGNNGILYKLKSEGDKLIIKDSIDNSDGLEGISVHGFQYMADGSIWCGTNLGVHRFEYSTWHPDSVLRYRFWNASKDVEFRGKESLIDRYGNIWVNSNHTLMKIKADDFDHDQTAYQPSLLSVKIKQNRWKSKKSEVNKWTKIPKNPIHLNYKENYVSFNFGMLYCDNLENIKYRYRLNGLDRDWSEWKRSNEVVYSNLKGGDYLFELEARKLSSDEISSYSVDVILDTAWWKTTWFWLVFLSLLGLAIYYGVNFFKSRIRFEEKQRTKQFNRVIGLKIKALQYQLDPHFIFNSLNSIQSYILDEEEDKALEYLSDFSMVLRNNINNANKNMIALNEELAYLKLYLKLEQMRFEEKFNFQINVDENINPLKVQIPPMLIQPFLEHAIRYGISKLDKTGKLVIRFILEEDGYLKCVITDNGSGNRKIDIKDTESDFIAGNSLQTTCDRMKLLNKVLANGRTYSYQINEFIDSKTNFSGVITEIGFPKI